MSERRVLLTGATGFVGGSVYSALVAGGWQVRCLTRNAQAARQRRPEVSWAAGDVVDADAMAHVLARTSSVATGKGQSAFREWRPARECFWSLIGHERRLRFAEAGRRALAAEAAEHPMTGAWAAVERARRVVQRPGILTHERA
jgi:nucleoside-diphosphate-sugar epimerase